jgi:ABC-2 type transport system permease protein
VALRARILWVCYWRVVREFLRIPLSVFVIPLVLPIFIMTIMARVYAQVATFAGTGWYPTYLVPACVLIAAMLGSGTAGVTTAIERQTRFYDRMRISPAGSKYGHIGRRVGDMTRLGAFGVLLVLVARINGTEIADWPLTLALAAGFAAFWGFAYGGLSFSLCLRTGSAEISQALIPLFFPVLFMSTAVMPRELLPQWLSTIAKYNPVTYISSAIRGGIYGYADSHAILLGIAGTAGLGLVTQILVWRAARHVASV